METEEQFSEELSSETEPVEERSETIFEENAETETPEYLKHDKEVNENEQDTFLSNLILKLEDSKVQNLFDSLVSSVVNKQSRDTVLHLLFTKGIRVLRESKLLQITQEEDTSFALLIGSLPESERQVLFDSVCSSIENHKGRETVLHILFWKASRLVREFQNQKRK
ncbi:hypothetical protein [Leptospira yasudae]|uniref:hypothetical protein n=1 Tax=Leptospira yasudae TaxID=2202201 RepID=UPI001090F434|nr:hypothetical protein [Leptospira yasudae]TGM99722.1 hypothetical protein EHR10_09025 [Leptospira yasudae]